MALSFCLGFCGVYKICAVARRGKPDTRIDKGYNSAAFRCSLFKLLVLLFGGGYGMEGTFVRLPVQKISREMSECSQVFYFIMYFFCRPSWTKK